MDRLTLCPADIIRHICSFLYYNPDVAILSRLNKEMNKITGLYPFSQHRSKDVVQPVPIQIEHTWTPISTHCQLYARCQDGLARAPYFRLDRVFNEMTQVTRVGTDGWIESSFRENGRMYFQSYYDSLTKVRVWSVIFDAHSAKPIFYSESGSHCTIFTISVREAMQSIEVWSYCSMWFDFDGNAIRGSLSELMLGKPLESVVLSDFDVNGLFACWSKDYLNDVHAL